MLANMMLIMNIKSLKSQREKYCLDMFIDRNQWDKWKVMKKIFKTVVK